MANGGFRVAYNAQVTTATGVTIIVGINVSDNGSDLGLLPDACENARRRYCAMPGYIVTDGGFNCNEVVKKVGEQGVKSYCGPSETGTEPTPARRLRATGRACARGATALRAPSGKPSTNRA